LPDDVHIWSQFNNQLASFDYFIIASKMTRYITAVTVLLSIAASDAFAPSRSAAFSRSVQLSANIRGPSEKSKELRFGTT